MDTGWKPVADLHTHTVASGHAYSTIDEIAQAAARKGLLMVAITDHGPSLPGGPHRYHFGNLEILPRQLYGVKLLYGVEANIIDEAGQLDLPENYLQNMDLVWASMHPYCFEPAEEAVNTKAMIGALKKPSVDGIAHPGNPEFPVMAEKLVEKAWEEGKVLEINNSSFKVRSGSEENCRKIARLSRDAGVKMVVNSDAHFHDAVGEWQKALTLLGELNVPENLVINTRQEEIINFLNRRRERTGRGQD